MADLNEVLTGDDDVDHLLGATRLLNLEIKIVNLPKAMPPWFKVIDVSGQFGSFRCLVDDEYEDVDGFNHPRALQALLLTVFDYFDADNDDVWYQKNDIDGRTANMGDLLLGLKGFWQSYKAQISNSEQIINPYAWQINEGPAQILRRLGKKKR